MSVKSIINLRTKSASEFSEDPTVMHLLPIEFRDYNGPARVSNFFVVKEIKEEQKKEEKSEGEETESKTKGTIIVTHSSSHQSFPKIL
jgi:hypothetical protein